MPASWGNQDDRCVVSVRRLTVKHYRPGSRTIMNGWLPAVCSTLDLSDKEAGLIIFSVCLLDYLKIGGSFRSYTTCEKGPQ